jgi:hypothetical protein
MSTESNYIYRLELEISDKDKEIKRLTVDVNFLHDFYEKEMKNKPIK